MLKILLLADIGKDRYHSVVSKENSLFNKLYGKEFCVNSSHHQAIDKLGSGLIPTLYCKNIIEGCEHITKPYITAQFHPERMCLEYENSQIVNGLKLFKHFIDLTKKYS